DAGRGERLPRVRLQPDPDAVGQRGRLGAARRGRRGRRDRHDRQARLRAPDRPARPRRPDRPRHLRRDHGGARAWPRRREVRALPVAPRARRCRAARPEERPRLLRVLARGSAGGSSGRILLGVRLLAPRLVSGVVIPFAALISTSVGGQAGTAPPRPSSGRCAAAWNLPAPAAGRAVARMHRVRRATVEATSVSHAVFWWDRSHARTIVSGTAAACIVVLFLPPRSEVTFLGAWKNGTVPTWGRPIRRALAGDATGNACVAPDGTIHHVRPFTAPSRCR